MKKFQKLTALALTGAMAMSLAACGENDADTTPTPAAGETKTYTASAKGYDGDVTVTLTVTDGKVESLVAEGANETPALGGAAIEGFNEGFAALVGTEVSALSGEVDTVSGATFTSTAVNSALKDVVNQANGISADAGKTAVADGTYTAKSPSFGLLSQMECEVTFENGAIKDVKVISESDSATGEWFASAQANYIPRLLENQSLATDAITGATVSSNAIRSCVASAIDAAGGKSSEWYTAVNKSENTVKLEGYDVIVVGLGGSGTLSYCAAAQEGATVFGIEAAAKVGGDASTTYGPMALNSEYLKNTFNNGEDYINADDVYSTWMEYVESDEKADVIYKAVYNSGSALDYYVENFGFEFQGLGLLGSFVVPEWDKLWCVYSADNDNTSWNILGPNKTFQFTRALEIANGKNEKNQYMTELTATSLIFDGDEIVGVNAEYYDGTKYEIYGKSVILATGGFIGNGEMMNEYLGGTVNTIGVTVNDGTGIQMGISAGGATYGMGTLPMVHISQVKNIIRTDDLTADQKAILSALALTTDQKMITTEGNVWGNDNQSGTQDEGVTVEIVFAPDYMYYVVYSQNDIDSIKNNGLSEAQSAAVSTFLSQGGTLPAAGTPVTDIEEILTVGEEYGNVIKADSISALAAAIGCDEANLTAALGEDGTYYAVACVSYAYATVGGLDVDANMNVLKEDGTPIANLFAVGQDSEGVCNVDGKAYTPWGGQAQSWTFVSGQIAGTEAAKVASAR